MDFEDNIFSSMYQTAGDCIANLLTSSLRPARPFIYHATGDSMTFTTEVENDVTDDDISITILNSEYSVEEIPPELGIESLQHIDYRDPNVTSLNRINSRDLEVMAMVDVPQVWRDRAVAIPERLRNHPELIDETDQPFYWKKGSSFWTKEHRRSSRKSATRLAGGILL